MRRVGDWAPVRTSRARSRSLDFSYFGRGPPSTFHYYMHMHKHMHKHKHMIYSRVCLRFRSIVLLEVEYNVLVL